MADFTVEIAGQAVAVRSLFESTKDYCRQYLTDENAQLQVAVTQKDLLQEQTLLDEEATQEGLKRRVFSQPFLERNFLQRRIAQLLLEKEILLLHGSAVALDGQGYLFTAKCGTGKSTHARLWREALGAVTVNDDKPFLRRTDEGWLLCGSPWCGKHGLGSNLTVPLKGICVLERGKENRIARVSSHPELTHQLCTAEDSLVASLLSSTALWHMTCTPTPEAARMAYDAMGQG